MSTAMVITIIVAVVIIGSVLLFNMQPESEIMMEEGEAMMDEGKDMMEEGEAMMDEGKDMMEEGETLKQDNN